MVEIEAAYNASLAEAATKLSDVIDRLMYTPSELPHVLNLQSVISRLTFESSPSARTLRHRIR